MSGCLKCIEEFGQVPSPWGDSVLELDAYDTHRKKHKSPGDPAWTVRCAWSHSGRRPRIGRTSGGWAVDWLGYHVSFRRWM